MTRAMRPWIITRYRGEEWPVCVSGLQERVTVIVNTKLGFGKAAYRVWRHADTC